ncbi:MAG TPA: peptide ABC transporter substrate-binding protein [Chloroflexaceae bacterium]|nr:peptide ABC transporter substrate-binding protein [Chloroflexaceae bacterium]
MSFAPSRRLFLGSLAAALLTLALLAGCALAGAPQGGPAPQPEAPTEAAPPTATPLPRGGELSVGLAADLPDLRPWQPRSRGEEQLTAMLYSGLMRLDDRLRPVPDLAEGWETTPDGRTITFTLRPDLRWHDGEPLGAGDVLFTLERLRGLPLTATALLADLRYIEAATAPTSSTVVLTLTSRFAPVLSTLAVPILPRHLLADRDIGATNFWEVAVGSGPFRLAERRPGEAYVLERFEQFHRGAPLLDGVTFLVTPGQEGMAGLADGRLLLAELPWGLQSTLAQSSARLALGAYPENGYYFLGFNLREGRPFADPRLREALALAIDLPRLVESVTKGQGAPIGSSALPGSWADLTPPPAGGADLDAARALLDAAGWALPAGSTIRQREGEPLAATLYVRGDDERRVLAARQIAEAGAAIGMQIQVEPADFATVILARYAPPFDFDLLLGSWSNGAGDPDYADVAFYDPDDFALFHSSQLNQGESDERSTRNFVGYSDPDYDSHAQAARQLYNLDERAAAITQAQARLAADRPYLFLWADRIPVAASGRLTTLDGPIELDSPLYYWNIERWHLAP